MSDAEIHCRPDLTSLTATDSIDEWIASAERIRSMLAMRVAVTRELLVEVEARATAAPELLPRLGAIITDAEQVVGAEGAEAGVVTALHRPGRPS